MADPNTFTGAQIDRAGDGRRSDEAWVEAQRADPRARALILGNAGVRSDFGRLGPVPLSEAIAAHGASPVLLGMDGDGPLWAIDADPPGEDCRRPRLVGAVGPRDVSAVEGREGWMGLREAAAALGQSEGGLAAYAAALLNWHRANRFCGNCGTATVPAEGGTARHCPRCGTQHHPRTDPVVIMLVTGPEGVLLGRQPSWPERRYSALAGFVGPGESLEEAVAREVEEEAGVVVGPPVYTSSQPWPFPASLMVGFLVPWVSGEPGGTDPELQDVRWFGRGQVAEAATRNDDWTGDDVTDPEALLLPPPTAIARRLVEGWLAG